MSRNGPFNLMQSIKTLSRREHLYRPFNILFNVQKTGSSIIYSYELLSIGRGIIGRFITCDDQGLCNADKSGRLYDQSRTIGSRENIEEVFTRKIPPANDRIVCTSCNISLAGEPTLVQRTDKECADYVQMSSSHDIVGGDVEGQKDLPLSGKDCEDQGIGSDFYEEVKVTAEAGEPLMPRSLLDLQLEDFIHMENKMGHLLWQKFRAAAALKGGFTCESVLTAWLKEGNIASRDALVYCVLAFRSWKKEKRALELFSWVMTENVFEMSDVDHSIYLDLVAKVDCCKKASQYLLRIPKQLQSDVVYSALLAAYLEHGKESSAKRLLLQVRALDLGDQIFLFNQLLAFYKGKGRISEVANLLKEMEDTGVQANLSTYNIILDLRARKGDISGMRKLWKHLEEVKIAPDAASYALLAKGYMKAGLWDRACRAVKEIETIPFSRKRVVYRWLLKLHAQLNRADDLERIWNMLKDVSKLSIDDYSIMVECLGKADEVERAEEIFKEGVHRFGIKRLHQYHTLISVLLDHGRMEKVEALVKEMMTCPFNLGSATYHQLIELYAKSGDQEKAMQTLQKAQNASKVFSGQKPWYISYLTLLEMFGRKGDIERAELIVRDLKLSGYPCGFRIYNALLMAYVKAKKMPHGFLDRMRADGAIPNSQMRKELNKVMDNRRELYQMNGARRYLF